MLSLSPTKSFVSYQPSIGASHSTGEYKRQLLRISVRLSETLHWDGQGSSFPLVLTTCGNQQLERHIQSALIRGSTLGLLETAYTVLHLPVPSFAFIAVELYPARPTNLHNKAAKIE